MEHLALIWALCAIGAAQQPATTFQQQQCPCVMKPGTSECLQYDTRYQAITLDDAIGSFVDLTLEDDDKPPEKEKTEADELCQTPECKACRKRLKQRLKKVGLLNEFIAPEVAAAQMGEEAEMCNKYRFSRKDAAKYEYWKVKGKKIKSGEDSDSDSDSNEDDDAKHGRHFLKQFPFYGSKHRFIRQAQTTQNNANSAVVGTRYNLSCTPKGVATDTSGFVSLCAKCWAWRQLPDNYFPRYLNELVCDDSDGTCLSGYATCGVGTRTVEVIRNDTGRATVVTLTAGSFCECRCQQGSALESLVTGAAGSLQLPLPVGTGAPPSG